MCVCAWGCVCVCMRGSPTHISMVTGRLSFPGRLDSSAGTPAAGRLCSDRPRGARGRLSDVPAPRRHRPQAPPCSATAVSQRHCQLATRASATRTGLALGAQSSSARARAGSGARGQTTDTPVCPGAGKPGSQDTDAVPGPVLAGARNTSLLRPKQSGVGFGDAPLSSPGAQVLAGDMGDGWGVRRRPACGPRGPADRTRLGAMKRPLSRRG